MQASASPHHLSATRRGDEGVTLVELMIALALSAILAAGVFALMSGQSRTYASQVERMAMQERLWGTLEFLQRQVRLAGYGLAGPCPGRVLQRGQAGGPAVMPALAVYNACNLFDTDPAGCCSNLNPGACTSALPTDGPDSFTVTTNSNVNDPAWIPGIRLTQAMGATDQQSSIAIAAGLTANDLFFLWEPGASKSCVLRQLTADPLLTAGPAYQLAHDSSSPINGPSGANVAYEAGTMLFSIGAGTAPRHFAIDRSATPPRLVTWTTDNQNPSADKRNLEVLADGIEDLQLAYACDAGDQLGNGAGDGTFTEGANPAMRQTDEWAFNEAGETYVPGCANRPIRVVRITVVGRSASADPRDVLGFRPASEDHAAGTPAQDQAQTHGGTFARAVLSVQVRPRNLL